MLTVGELMEELKKYPKEMEIKIWISPTEQLELLSIYESDEIKNRPQHLNFDMQLEP